MATKKKRGGRDDFGFDDDLDFDIPDFSGDNPAGVSNDRKPISTGLKSAAAGFGKSFTSEARLRKTLTKSLPREYEEPISKAFDIKDGARDLYNIAGAQVNETVRETKRSVGRIARNLEGSLPRGLADRLKKFGDSADNDSPSGPSKSEIEDGTINNAFAQLFADVAQNDADNRKKDNAKKVIQDSIDKKRHADMTTILGSIDQSLIAMHTWQEKVGNGGLKKQLELQFRTYFVQNDMLQLQTKFFQQFRDDLSAITKNTGLPDFVKKAPKEALLEHMRNAAFESMGNSITKRRNQWLSGAFKKAGQKVNETFSGLREGLSQVLDTAEMASSMAGSGMGPSAAELVGDAAGSWAGGKVQDRAAKYARKFTKANPGTVKFGNKASQVIGALPQWVNEQMNNGKYANQIPDFLRDILGQDGESSGIRLNKEVDLERAKQFSDKNSRSLNVVIPELLSKIHHELYVTRTGDVSAAPLTYDYEKGKFISHKEKASNLKNSIVSKQTVDQTQHQTDSFFKEIDPDGTKLDKNSRDKIMENLYGANKRGVYFNNQNLQIHAGDEKGAELMRQYMDGDTTGGKERRLSKLAGRIGSHNGEVGDYVQALIDSGRHGELADMGLIDLKTGQINLDMVRRMELGQDTSAFGTPPGLPASPGNQAPNGFGKTLTGANQGNKGLMSKLFKGKNKQQPQMVSGGPQDLSEIVDAFKEATKSLSNIKANGRGDDSVVKELKESLEKFSGKSELIEIRDILKKIEEKGISGGGIMTPEMVAEYISNQASGYFGKAGKLGRKAAGAFGKFMGSGASSSWNMSKKVLGLGKKGAAGLGGWLTSKKDRFDLFIGEEVKPRLDKAKLEAGKYIDAATGKVITKYEDIQGDVKDIDTGEVVLYITELRNAVLKNIETGKSVLVRGLNWGKKAAMTVFDSAKKSASRLMAGAKGVYGMAWAGVKKAYEHLTDGPQDVYLKDSYETPVLLKRVMEKGLYFDKESLDAITKVSQIKGPVVDNENNVLITKEDLHNGLYYKNGQEIKTGFDRLLQFAGNSINKTIGTYKKILGKAKDMGAKAMAWMKGLFGFDSPFTVFSKKTNDILAAIYGLLNARLPGEKSPELDAMIEKNGRSEGGLGGAVKTGTKVMDKLRGLKDKHFKLNREMIDEKTGQIKDGATRAVEKLTKLIDERMPPKVKDFFDSNGDGTRDGSIDDIRSKRQKAKDALTGVKDKIGDKVKGSSAYGAIADFLKKRKKKDEEEGSGEGKDGDTFIDMGGDGDKKEKGKKPRGKIGRGWDKLKDKLTPKGKGLGAKTIRGGGKLLGMAGRGALGLGRLGLGLAGILGVGGLSSVGTIGTLGSMALGGLGIIGSALGMAASAVGAIISSPITVPALAVAAVGTAGYFAYKWLTKPDPKPIEKVRLVQYGWKATDIEAYKKMKSLESKVEGAVTFAGEKAEFDPKKLNIKDMMKDFGLDQENQDHAKKFITWFAGRFRPVYLNHRALIKTTNSPKDLANVDDNKPEFKKTYLDQCLFPGGHYGVVTSPNKDENNLFTTQYTVERQIETAKSEVEQEGTKKTEDKAKEKTEGVAKVTATAALAAKLAEDKATLAKEQDKTKSNTPGVPKDVTGALDAAQPQKPLSRMERSMAGSLGPGAGAGSSNPNMGPSGPVGGGAGTGATATAATAAADAGGPPKSKPNIKPMAGSAAKVKEALLKLMPKYGITSPNQQAALLGNIEHESNFQPISENLNYKAAQLMKLWPKRFPTMDVAQALASQGPQAIANSIYGGRMGNTGPNDGWDYRGRGPIQITGKHNYTAIGKIIGKDIVNNPDMLITDPTVSAESALGYWKMNPGLGKNADAGNFAAVRKAINGGDIGKDDALARTQSYLAKIKSGELKLDGTATASTGGDTAASPTGMVASPKPATPNTAADFAASKGIAPPTTSVSGNPNMGPAPTAYDAKPATPSTMVASPRPSYDPSSSSSASAPVTAPSAPSQFVKQQSSVNTGDSIEVLKSSLDVQKASATSLEKIVSLLEGMPKSTADALREILNAASGASKPAPSEANNFGRQPAPMPQTSNGFKRQFAGT